MTLCVTLCEAHKYRGRRVVYAPYDGCPADKLKYGVITSVYGDHAYVRYGPDKTGSSKATNPSRLSLY